MGGLVGLFKIRRLMKAADQALSAPWATPSTWENLLVERVLDELPVPGLIAEPVVRWLVRHARRGVGALKMGP